MAATNRVDILDEALIRPGRFDRKVRIDLPSMTAREAILKVHAEKRPLSDDIDFSAMAKLTSGMSGAEIADVVNQGSLFAARRDAGKRMHTRTRTGTRTSTRTHPRACSHAHSSFLPLPSTVLCSPVQRL